MTLPSKGNAIVKSVLSGDTVVLRGKAAAGPPIEQVLTLSNIVVPRFSREAAEDYSLEARDFLRTLVVGKAVKFSVVHSLENNRHFGNLELQQPFHGETNVTLIMIKAGYAKCRPGESKFDNEETLDLKSTEAEACKEMRGIWTKTPYHPLKISQQIDEDARVFLNSIKGEEISACVEQVRDGSNLRMLLYLPNNTHQYINLNISGIQAPSKVNDRTEPYFEEARFFVETRILQRNVKVNLESATGKGAGAVFYGTISHPAGNIAKLLLKEGLAKVVDWNLPVDTAELYRNAEIQARSQQLRIWQTVRTTIAPINDKEFPAVVKKVVGPDTLIVSSLSNLNDERKYHLASIRGPKRQKDEAGQEIGYFLNATEFLRHRLVGSKVRVRIEYTQPADGEYSAKTMVSIFKNDKNIGAALILNGLASLVRHRKDDNNRSSAYAELLEAEHLAIEGKKGIHGPEIPVHKIMDISSNTAKANSFLSDLQRRDHIKAVVEHVFAGSRFKVLIPSMNLRLSLALSCIRTPRTGGNTASGQKPEAFGKEALEFATSKTLQRDVEISIDSVDKVGAFTGNLLLYMGGEKVNFAKLLLENGFASIHEGSASKSAFKSELFSAMEKAKAAKLNIWAQFKEEPELVLEDQPEVITDKPMVFEMVISDIRQDGTFCIQKIGQGSEKLKAMMNAFELFHRSSQSVPTIKFNTGQYCSAKFSFDNEWYRAKILKVQKDKYHVLYADYGNTEEVGIESLRPLPIQFSVQKLAPQAIEAKLAYLEMPFSDEEFGEQAYSEFSKLVQGVELLGSVVQIEKMGLARILAYRKPSTEFGRLISVNEMMAQAGLAYIPEKILNSIQLSKISNIKSLQLTDDSNSISEREIDWIVESVETAKTRRVKFIY